MVTLELTTHKEIKKDPSYIELGTRGPWPTDIMEKVGCIISGEEVA